MTNKIMYILANILMVVESATIILLLWAWKDAKRKQTEAARKNPPFARELMPMGALTYAIACSHCKNRSERLNSETCRKCLCEIESGFEVDPDTFKEESDGKM